MINFKKWDDVIGKDTLRFCLKIEELMTVAYKNSKMLKLVYNEKLMKNNLFWFKNK